ncbi:MAG: bifunctional NADH dehydrogenase FAD-containing subunit/selenide, water dikinase SelD, partial [Candidatus Hydrogenedentota bacterium]
MKKLVLLGGGHSQIEVLRQLAMRPIEDVATTIISRELLAPYSGMLPGFIAGHYTHRESHIDLRNLAEAASARLVYAEASNIDPESQQVLFDDRSPVSYDVLSINVGSRPVISNVAGISEFALPAKPVDVFIEGWEEILEKA